MSDRDAESSIEVDAPPEARFAALTDYESMPDWQRAVVACEVVGRDEAGQGRDVDWTIDARLRSISYRLRYTYERPRRIAFEQVSGDPEDVRGSYSPDRSGRGRTRVTLVLRVRAGVPVPGPLERFLTDRVMRGALDDLRARAEACI